MLQEPLTLSKLIILYMLNQIDFPISITQISDFILDREYTNFWTLHQAIGELTDTGMLSRHSINSKPHLTITEEGIRTLYYFDNRIDKSIKQDIISYLREHKMSLRNKVAVQSNYYKSTSGEYEAHLVAKEKDITLVDITLSVPTEDTAAAICDNWHDKNETIYQYLTQELF